MTDLIFDVTACLLLVSASTGLVATAGAGMDTDLNGDIVVDADGVTLSLATNTATVNYSLSPGVDAAGPSLPDTNDIGAHELERIACGSLAELLVHSALGAVTIDGVCLTRARSGFRRQAAVHIVSELPTCGVSIAIPQTPFPGSSVRANDTPGPEPPSSATVYSATLDMPGGLPAACEDAIVVSNNGFDTIARPVVDRAVVGLFPPMLAQLALRDDEPVSTLIVHRYERADALVGASVALEAVREETRTTSADLAAALNPRFAKTMRTWYDTPYAATEAVPVGRVTVVVRTWSP